MFITEASIRVALVGAGGWGRHHAQFLDSRPNVDFCAVVGRDPERTKQIATFWGVHGYIDTGEMLRQEHPDLVILSLPNLEHFAPTLQVIEASIALLSKNRWCSVSLKLINC